MNVVIEFFVWYVMLIYHEHVLDQSRNNMFCFRVSESFFFFEKYYYAHDVFSQYLNFQTSIQQTSKLKIAPSIHFKILLAAIIFEEVFEEVYLFPKGDMNYQNFTLIHFKFQAIFFCLNCLVFVKVVCLTYMSTVIL